MPIFYSSYYGLARVNNMSPDAKGWAATDTNFQLISLLIKAMAGHTHGGATPINYPGYNYATPATPVRPTLTEYNTDGVLAPATQLGVRLSFVDAFGLETDASPENVYTTSSTAERPDPPSISTLVSTPVPGAVTGGTYIYALTKKKGAGETIISDITTINIPFDSSGSTSYIVPLTFDPINGYVDGTTSIRIYRSMGYGSNFKLLKTLSSVSATVYNDVNSIEDPDIIPPSINTFDKNKKVRIDWTSLTPFPSQAYRLKVYVTQQPALYGTSHLLADYDLKDLATPTPNYVEYLGSEVLQFGYPQEFSQLISNPSKLNLGSEATGAPILTDNMSFEGFQARKFVLGGLSTATPIDGALYYDSSSSSLKARINGNWLTMATPTGQFIHSATEQGGHVSQNIIFAPGTNTTGPDLRTVLSAFATPVAQFRKQITNVTYPASTPVVLSTASTTATPIYTGYRQVIQPSWSGQWHEIAFSAHFQQLTTGVDTVFGIEIDGVLVDSSIRSRYNPASNANDSIHVTFATPFTKSNVAVRPMWWVSGGVASLLAGRNSLLVKGLA